MAYNIKKEFEKKDPLWIQFHQIEDKVKNKSSELSRLIPEMMKLAEKFLIRYSDREDVRDILVAFENLTDLLLYYYGEEAKAIYEDGLVGDILSSFDSLAADYDEEIQKLKDRLNSYLYESN